MPKTRNSKLGMHQLAVWLPKGTVMRLIEIQRRLGAASQREALEWAIHHGWKASGEREHNPDGAFIPEVF